jgi:hypothetical protein
LESKGKPSGKNKEAIVALSINLYKFIVVDSIKKAPESASKIS